MPDAKQLRRERMKTQRAGPKDIDDYIADFPGDVREILEKIRTTIRKAAPQAEETISYQIPTFTLKGNLVHFAAFKEHIGFYPAPSGVEKFQQELSVYNGAKGSVQFPFDKPVPFALISKIVRFRVEENLKKAETIRKAHGTVGYSRTPLVRKLGIKEGSRILPLGAPDGYVRLLDGLPAGVQFATRSGPGIDLVHVFVTRKAELRQRLSALRKKLRPDAPIWISWPKKASKVATDITEDTIREVALPLGYVDIKVCAVTEVWSGLKLVLRKELR
jgi:uncharacterized protein YdhG (YjbR/CyaY superfamily)